MAHQGILPAWVSKVDSRGRPRLSLAVTSVLCVTLTYINLSGEGITGFKWLSQIASTGYFMVWLVISITSFRFRAALRAQNDPLFTETYAWKCALWPFPPAWLFTCCCFYIGTSFYLALYPIVSFFGSLLCFVSTLGVELCSFHTGFRYTDCILLLPVHVRNDLDRFQCNWLQTDIPNEAA